MTDNMSNKVADQRTITLSVLSGTPTSVSNQTLITKSSMYVTRID